MKKSEMITELWTAESLLREAGEVTHADRLRRLLDRHEEKVVPWELRVREIGYERMTYYRKVIRGRIVRVDSQPHGNDKYPGFYWSVVNGPKGSAPTHPEALDAAVAAARSVS